MCCCRAGQKLEAALQHFSVNAAGKMALDAGICTGGFADCLLQHGATRVIGVDTGYGKVLGSCISCACLPSSCTSIGQLDPAIALQLAGPSCKLLGHNEVVRADAVLSTICGPSASQHIDSTMPCLSMHWPCCLLLSRAGQSSYYTHCRQVGT